MKILLFISFAILSFSGSFCSHKFEIIEASSQKWYGGARNSGYGTKYELTIIPKADSEVLKFDKLWIGSEYFPVSCFQKGKRIKNDTFGYGDTISIQINKHNNPKSIPIIEKDSISKENTKAPFKFKGEALLSYTYKSKRKYVKIEKFTEKEPLQYP